MASTVLQSVIARLRREGRLTGTTSTRLLASPVEAEPGDVRVVQRPPMAWVAELDSGQRAGAGRDSRAA